MSAPAPWVWRFPATCLRVIDADTVDASVDIGFRGTRVERLRLLGSTQPVNAYELHDKDAARRALAQKGKARVMELLPVGSPMTLRTTKADEFGRWLAEIILPDGRSLGDVLLAEGLAEVWTP